VVEPLLVVEPEVVETVLEVTSPIENPPVVAKTLLMFPMSTASNVYPSLGEKEFRELTEMAEQFDIPSRNDGQGNVY